MIDTESGTGRPGFVVTVYHDPITEREPEGRAKLVELLERDEGTLTRGDALERWQVEFCDEWGAYYERTIRVKGPRKGDKRRRDAQRTP